MKRSLQFICQHLRDVHTIIEYRDGTVTHFIRDKVNHTGHFVDNDREECLELLDTDKDVKHY